MEMKVAIIGVSGHIGIVLEGLKGNNDLELVGIAPADAVDKKESLGNIAEEFSCPIFDSYEKMLDETEPDVAGIATRYDLNGPVSLKCLERGIHCMTEKAIAHDFEMLEKLKVAAEENRVKIIGMHQMRYTPAYFAAYNALKSGAIGQPMLITGQKSYKFGNQRPEFYKNRETYGGTILWVASHAIDWTYWMMGDFSTLYAAHSSQNNFDYGDCESHAIMSFTFKNGGMGTINADFYQPQKSKIHGDDQVRIAGEKGIINVRYGKAFLTTHEQEEKELPLEDQGNTFFMDFCNEIRGDGKCRLSMADTFAVTRLCLSARKSADTGELILDP